MMLANGTAMWKGLARVLNRLAWGRAELKLCMFEFEYPSLEAPRSWGD